jgi:hypothetical protein
MVRIISILFISCLFFISCERTESMADSQLRFSEDTIYFDTVFSSVGSVTKELRIINQEKYDLVINHLYLSGGTNSQFRLNINGEPVNEKENILIESGDSIFVFVDVIVDPGNSNSPVAVSDSIIFSVNEKNQIVQLLAWGQDINLINKEIIGSETWGKGKPYVIYQNVTVDTLQTLTIEAGTRVYFHRNASMVIAGSIVVNGSAELPVLFAADRLEKMYEDIPGQWDGILILNSGKANNISHATIRNSVTGIQLGEEIFSTDVPVLKLYSSVVSHSSVSGLSALNGNVEAANCIFIHCGSSCIYLGAGGDYNFTSCTIFNRWEYGMRLSPAVLINEKPDNPSVRTSQMDVRLNNSVISGDNFSELNITPLTSFFSGNYYFDHCLIKLDTLTAPFWNPSGFPDAIINKDPHFISEVMWDMRPDTLSPLVNSGSLDYSAIYPFDIRGVSRTIYGTSDIGAYERIPGEHKKVK